MTRMLSLALLAVAVALPAAAQDTYSTTTTTTSEAYPSPYAHENRRGSSIGLMADVGGADYNRDAQHIVDAGVGYGLRADMSPVRNFGVELTYAGAVNNLADSISTDGRLITNQFGGDLRANLVPASRDLPLNLRPFVFGGAAYHRIDSDNFTPGIKDGINAFAVPVGAGLEAELGSRFLIGGRFTYNFLFNEIDAFSGKNTDMWAATVNLGTRLSGGY